MFSIALGCTFGNRDPRRMMPSFVAVEARFPSALRRQRAMPACHRAAHFVIRLTTAGIGSEPISAARVGVKAQRRSETR
jgi:hypothetical protein